MTDYYISIDLGTTTLAFLDSQGHSLTLPNRQSAFGADVISRIQASIAGHSRLLQELIQKDLTEGIERLLCLAAIPDSSLCSITIAANTSMTHLLMGYPCDGLAAFPFSPFTVEKLSAADCLPTLSAPVTLLPGASAFIGGDILSGLLSLDAASWERPCLLLDLGTNGEMVLGTRDSLFAASASAGPALEGGGISCGIAGIKGAICHYSMDRTPPFQTIRYGRPLGICGTGIIDLTAELLSHGSMDSTGLLTEPYFTQGFPLTRALGQQKALLFTQSDVRQVQMAKSAVHTGIELLCREYGISLREIHQVFLAGGLGTQMDPNNAARIGLFPKELAPKVVPAGNTSLAGAFLYASQPALSDFTIEKIRASLSCLELANLSEFQDLFISNLDFK